MIVRHLSVCKGGQILGRWSKSWKTVPLQGNQTRRNCSSLDQTRNEERKYEEVRIPVPWGHIAGKWWGPKNKQPVLAMHGWLDNANSFDPLMKLMPSNFSLLSLDLPGHGLSSHYPAGIPHHLTEDIVSLRRIIKHFGWQKVSFLCHSMGSTYAFIYSAIYPKEVNKLVGLDILRPFEMTAEFYAKNGGNYIDKYIETIQNTREPPESTLEDFAKRQHEGSKKSISVESSRILMERGAYQSKSKPGLIGLRRDVRLKVTFLHNLPHEYLIELASRIRCEVYNIKAKGGMYYEKKSHYKQTIEVLKKVAKAMQYFEVDGTHHTHLNTPENVVDIVKDIFCDDIA
ncbi:probable serine hydrolase isoform X1 [Cloeon dipterum]|uniref:probable serine hydrolase isoform X1 n=1 Tax=Cloeon dipterum TaxID=197152 RepID=UPI00321FF055